MFFRAVPIVPETNGRVAEVHVGLSELVKEGAPIFTLDDSKQKAAVELARRKVAEIDAALVAARADVVAAEGRIWEAKGAEQQALDKLRTKEELMRRNASAVAPREIEKLQVTVGGRQGSVAAAIAAKDAAEARVLESAPCRKEERRSRSGTS